MTQLGGKPSDELREIRLAISNFLKSINFREIDASTDVTGGDFLEKIWKQILAVPVGIAILTEDMKLTTVANIFYELGILDSLGKESIVIKSKNFQIPSDFVRTEYISFDGDFEISIAKFFENVNKREEHYSLMSELMQKDIVLSIDYLRRAFLISGELKYKIEAERLFNENKNNIDEQSKFMISGFLKSNI
ncbi:nucleotide-binding protein [Vitellibacter sp. q18]|nr:nucleotide-binding protein [Aequorivita lutea]